MEGVKSGRRLQGQRGARETRSRLGWAETHRVGGKMGGRGSRRGWAGKGAER